MVFIIIIIRPITNNTIIFTDVDVVVVAAAEPADNNLFSESEQRTVLVKTVTRTGTPPGRLMII